MTEVLRQVTITGVDEEFRGTFEIPGDSPGEPITVHIPGAAPGDVVDLWITSRSRHHPRAYAKVVGVHQRGEQFVAPPCRQAAPVRGACGGCPGMHLTEEVRRATLQRSLATYLGPLKVEATWHQAPRALGYRNRSNFVVQRREKDGQTQVLLGSFAPGSHDIAPMEGCLIVSPVLGAVHSQIQALLNAGTYPIGLDEAGLRWVSLRAAGDQVAVDLIVADESADYLPGLVEQIAAIDTVAGIALSLNDQATNSIRVSRTKTVVGDLELAESYGRVTIAVPAGAFAQLNPEVASQIYEMAANYAQDARPIWDLYCGIGALGINAAVDAQGTPRGLPIWGLESVDEAVKAAQQNADSLGINGHFQAVDLTDQESLRGLQPPDELQGPSAIFVNPPRRGLSDAVVARLNDEWSAPTLVYMSCSPKSFARDAQALIKGGWTLEKVDAFEMLPMTRHIEVLGIFRSP